MKDREKYLLTVKFVQTFYELEITCRSDVISTMLLFPIQITGITDTYVEILTKLDAFKTRIIIDSDILKKLFCNSFQSFYWPCSVPIDRATIYQWWKHAQTNAKCVTNWWHANHYVKISSNSFCKKSIQSHRSHFDVLTCNYKRMNKTKIHPQNFDVLRTMKFSKGWREVIPVRYFIGLKSK